MDELYAESRRVLSERLAADPLTANGHALPLWMMTDRYGEREDIEVPGWRKYAACDGEDLDTFFPESSQGAPGDYSRALELCRACPVAQQCDDYAEINELTDGVWAGLTPRERTRRRQEARRARKAA